MKQQKPLIQLKNVWKTYAMGETPLDVLKGISLEIYENEFVAILGPSGSGKSTLMNLIGALDVPSQGEIYVHDKKISNFSESELAQLRGKEIGFIFQQFNLLPMLTAMENVTLPTIFQGLSEEKRLQRAKQLLTMVGLAERLHHRPTELSGGQQQRVAIARALVNNPSIILADEPTGNLDSASGKQIMDLLATLRSTQGKTIILVTHDIDLVKFSDRTIYLKDGAIERIQVARKSKEMKEQKNA